MSFWNTHTWCSSHALNLNDSGLVFHLISDPLTTSKPSLNHPWSILEPPFHHHVAIISPKFQPQFNHHLTIKACKKSSTTAKLTMQKNNHHLTINDMAGAEDWIRIGNAELVVRFCGGGCNCHRRQGNLWGLPVELAFSCLRKVAESMVYGCFW